MKAAHRGRRRRGGARRGSRRESGRRAAYTRRRGRSCPRTVERACGNRAAACPARRARPAAPEQVGVQLRDPSTRSGTGLGELTITGQRRWSWRFFPTPGRSARHSIPSAASSSAGPSPESSRSRGESIAPAHDDHLAGCLEESHAPPPRSISTPVHRPPANRRRRAAEPVSTVRLDRPATGSRNADSGVSRTPSRIVELRVADAVELGAVVVGVERNARFLRRRPPWRRVHRVGLVPRGHAQRPSRTVVLGRPAVEVLGALEERQDVVEAPAVRTRHAQPS